MSHFQFKSTNSKDTFIEMTSLIDNQCWANSGYEVKSLVCIKKNL